MKKQKTGWKLLLVLTMLVMCVGCAYSLKLDSNPEFTSSVIVAYARAAYRMSQEGQKGCKTVFDVPPAYLSALDGAELRKHLL